LLRFHDDGTNGGMAVRTTSDYDYDGDVIIILVNMPIGK
jgi:hypothetical protein